jgi:hypothetical protein
MLSVGADIIAVVFVLLGMGAVGACLTLWLIARVWSHKKETGLAPKLATVLALAVAVLSGAGTLIGLVKALRAVSAKADPYQMASILAEGISIAVNCAAFGGFVWLPSLVFGFLLTRK